jgi:malate dehydrogenase (quinone)
MSATLATLLSELIPGIRIQVFERLEGVAMESTLAMNNAGTGHAANCELNYTPEKADGSVDIAKALTINAAFEVSLQLWSHLVETGALPEPARFLSPVPHLSFVWGDANVRFLRTRHQGLSATPMFQDMTYTEDPVRLAEWMPLVMDGRTGNQPLAATRVARGTDLDFGALARLMYGHLAKTTPLFVHYDQEVRDLQKRPDGRWRVLARDRTEGRKTEVLARFVFLGSGGGALPLLLKSGIPESRGYGGMPVSGQWLVCTNPEVVARHSTKVYGKALLGAPPMSVPHLDTRVIDGQKGLLFGPYAGFTTKFLKRGSFLDWPRAIHHDNWWPMAASGWHNLDLTRYLIGQVLQSRASRVDALRAFMPTARDEDWKLAIAGQRVQIVKKDPVLGGKLEFGTEVVTAADGSLSALLGASPGASTAATTMVDLIRRCFPDVAATDAFKIKLQRIVPSFGHDLSKEPEVLSRVRARNNAVLGLG